MENLSKNQLIEMYKQQFKIDPKQVKITHRPEAWTGYEWEAKIELRATSIQTFGLREDERRTEVYSSFLIRHGSTEKEARDSLQNAFEGIISCITV